MEPPKGDPPERVQDRCDPPSLILTNVCDPREYMFHASVAGPLSTLWDTTGPPPSHSTLSHTIFRFLILAAHFVFAEIGRLREGLLSG